MTTDKTNLSVPEEQVSTAEDTRITTQNDETAEEPTVRPQTVDTVTVIPEEEIPATETAKEETPAEKKTVVPSSDIPDDEKMDVVPMGDAITEKAEEETVNVSNTPVQEEIAMDVSENLDAGGDCEVTVLAIENQSDEVSEPAAESTEEATVDFSQEEAELAAEAPEFDLGDDQSDEETGSGESGISFHTMSKAQLLDTFAQLLDDKPVQSIRKDVEAIKVAFYKQHRAEVDQLRRAHTDAGGNLEEFTLPGDNSEQRLKDLFSEYRKRRDEYIGSLEKNKEDNLKIKLGIIEELKELVQSGETLNNTFNTFRDLQQRWKDAGPVPQAFVKDIWETYNHHVENFYGFIKINKELRDLDLRKNYETKTTLCEEAEALILEPSIVTAFHKLQKLHDQWRETGPVAHEQKEALWERFREASSRINKQHQEYFERLKDEQKRNLDLKTELCVKTEELTSGLLTNRKDWNRASSKLLEIQKVWKTIGFAPKKENTKIYERFRSACDRFFEQKRNFYLQVKTEMEHNLELKNEICRQAEALKDSDDWKKTTDDLIALQKQWKETGPVSRRHSDIIWKRFRTACDSFFERKSAHFSSQESQYEDNLRLKQELLTEIEQADIKAGGFEMIKEFQRRWGEIGFVPIKQKDSIQKQYKAAMDKLFAAVRGSDQSRHMDRFRDKVSNMKESGDRRLRFERDRLYNKVKQLESDIALLENNIGFFSKSKNAEAMIEEVRRKIERTREEMTATIEKINLIDKQQ